MKSVVAYFRRCLVAFDQMVNTVFGGHEDETISSRLGRHVVEGEGWARAVCAVVSWVLRDENHCVKSIEPRCTCK